MDTIEELSAAAEQAWLERWTTGPLAREGTGLIQGTPAPDVALPDETGVWRRLSEFWGEGPALPYVYQYCEAFPDPAVLVAAAQLSRPGLHATS